MSFGEVLIRFGADIGPFQVGLKQMMGLSDGLGAGLGKSLAVVGAIIVASAIGVGIASVKMAGDFQAGMTQLVTGAGEAQSNIALVSQGILALAVSSGTSTKDLSAGMYLIESAGYHGAAGLAVLTAAAEGAKVGNASLADVANGVTTAMTDYAAKNLTAAQATNFLIAVVANGKTHMGDLASSMSTILPTAGALGVRLIDVGGAMATMTGEGTGAAQASTYLRQMLMSLAAPAAAGAKSIAAIGLTTQQVSDGMKTNLPATLQLIMTHLKDTYTVGSPEYVTALKNIAGGAKQMQGMLELTGSHLATFQTNVGLVSTAVDKGGKSIIGWSTVQGDFNFKLDQAKQAANVLMITLGTALIPAITGIVSAVVPAITSFTNWITSSNGLHAVLANIGNVIGLMSGPLNIVTAVIGGFVNWLQQGGIGARVFEVALAMIVGSVTALAAVSFASAIAGFIAFQAAGSVGTIGNLIATLPTMIGLIQLSAVAAWEAAVAFIAMNWPILAIGAAIALVVIGVIVVIKNWGAISQWLLAVWNTVLGALKTAWSASLTFFQSVWGAVASFFVSIWTNVASFFTSVWTNVISFFTSVWSGVTSVVSTVVSAIVGFFVSMWARIQPVLTVMKIALAIIFAPLIIAIALVAAPFVGLVLLITHFQQVMAALRTFLATVWAAIVNLIATAFSTIGGWFTWLYNHNTYIMNLCNNIRVWFTAVITWLVTAWQTAVATITAVWQAWISFATAVWNLLKTVITVVVSAIVAWLVSAWQTFTGWITALWQALTGVATTSWTAVSNTVKAVVQTVISWLQAAWTFEVRGLTIIWNTLSGLASAAWNAVSSAVMSVVSAITSWAIGQWNTFKAQISAGWNAMAGLATAAWNAVTGAFRAAWGGISSALGTILSNITSWFTGLAAKAVSWGAALIQGFINGITSMVGNVTGAIGHIAGIVGNFLGFHSSVIGPAKEGPGRDLDKWGPALSSGFAAGILQNLPLVQSAMNRMMSPFGVGASGAASSAQAAGAGIGSGGTKQPIQLNMSINGRTFATALIPDLAQTISVQMGGSH